MQLLYPDIPEIFLNNTRRKYVYNNGTLIWPINKNTGKVEYAISFDASPEYVSTKYNSGWERTENQCLKNIPIPMSMDPNKIFIKWVEDNGSQEEITNQTVFVKDTKLKAVWEIQGSSTDPEVFGIKELLESSSSGPHSLETNPKVVGTDSNNGYYVIKDRENDYLLLYLNSTVSNEDGSTLNPVDIVVGNSFEVITGFKNIYKGTTEFKPTQAKLSDEFYYINDYVNFPIYNNWSEVNLAMQTKICPEPVHLVYQVLNKDTAISVSGNYVYLNDVVDEDGNMHRIGITGDSLQELLNLELIENNILDIYGYVIFWGQQYTILLVKADSQPYVEI